MKLTSSVTISAIGKFAASILLIIAAVTPVWADGDCPTRKSSAAEEAQYSLLQNTLRAALPRPPANYKADVNSLAKKLNICEAHPADKMVGMYFNVDYTATIGETQDRQLHADITDRMKGTPQQQERLAALDAKEAALIKARKNADRDEKERIKAELKTVRAQARDVQQEIDRQVQTWVEQGGMAAAMQRNQGPRLPTLNVSIAVNRKAYLPGHAKPCKVKGAPLAFEYSDSATYNLTILLGRYNQDNGELQNTGSGVSTKARGIALTFRGPVSSAQSVRDLANRTDIAKLGALLR